MLVKNASPLLSVLIVMVAARLQELMNVYHEVIGIPNLKEKRPTQHFDVRKAETCLRKINIAISSIIKSCRTPEQQNEVRRIYSSMAEELKGVVTGIRREFLQEVGEKLGMQL
mmetsp:Transcript_23751/g.77324  ORF Transcript_23751/g.77324 Transcript_23751/m.77324 type:complete len:113 (+) Transcript_23751:2527-2865(+)